MVMFSKHASAKPVSAKYLKLRQDADKAINLNEFSDEDILNGDLKDGFTEGLPVPTGEGDPNTYRTDPRITSEGTEKPVDVRTLENR